ncbi:Na/Pi symporter [Corynebacterium alimapuense]|uniref:Na/Pi cotransporter family protein n=1 Tax=Corynebacterium alimapuense TaxID=1576874 RepID=A0A3M8KBH9_9CORY|nr:Na/Pi symporter [Corynebacterium alimapuense]RNE49914.1 Na/Pi cotransporter family protein [Corynebacterium alimapuense]
MNERVGMATDRVFPRAQPGTQQYINPSLIPPGGDFVALSRFGSTMRWLTVALTIVLMISSIYLILDGATGLGSATVSRLFVLAANPIIGLLIGILATATIQSSSTVTALTVAAVATGGVSVPVAVPIILGANVGTTITPLILAFSYLGDRKQFQRAFTSASLHTWFNLIFVVAAFLLEMLFHPLQQLTWFLSEALTSGGQTAGSSTGGAVFSFFSPLMKTIGHRGFLGSIMSTQTASMMSILIGAILVLLCMQVLKAQLSVLTAATTRPLLERSSGASDALGFFSGTTATMAVQASSVTISSLLPFAAARSLSLRNILVITLGANVGTTFMALLTALAVPGAIGTFAIQAALVHVTFNVLSTLIMLLILPLRELVIRLAERSGKLAVGSCPKAVAWMLGGYFLLPSMVIISYALIR